MKREKTACHCKNITYGMIEDAIKNGAKSYEDVEKKLGLNVLGTLPLEEAEDDGENCSGSKKGFSKARKKSKKRAGDKS